MEHLGKIKRAVFFFVVGTLPLAALLLDSNFFESLLSHPKPPGQTLFLLVRASGLYAIYALALQITLALWRPKNLLGIGLSWGRSAHITLGSLSACLILMHVLLFLSAGYLRTGVFPWAALVPEFFEGYYKQRIGLGVLAVWLTLVTVLAGILRAKFPNTKFDLVHKFGFLIFVLAVIHSFSIGSDTRTAIVVGFYSVLVLSVLAAIRFYFLSRKT